MSRSILSIILIIISVGVFVTFVDPVYSDIRDLRRDVSQFDEALNKSKELQAIRDSLLGRYNTFSSSDLDRIEKLLPDNVDNVRLILDLDGIASKYGILVRDVSINEDVTERGEDVVVTEKTFGKIELSFSVTAPYNEFKKLMRDLEQSLRLVDLKKLSFRPKESNPDLIDFNLTITTYWLK